MKKQCKYLKTGLLLISALALCRPAFSAVSVSQYEIADTNFVQMLAGQGVSVSNGVWEAGGQKGRLGGYTNAAPVFGASGIIFSTGSAKLLEETQNSAADATVGDYNSATAYPEASIETKFSALLTQINGNASKQEAAWIAFDIYPQGGWITIDYALASEEYPEVQNTIAKSDVFAFFVNGTNYAVLADGTTPICPKTVNARTNSSLYTENCIYSVVTNVGFGVTNRVYTQTTGTYSTASVPPIAFNSEYDGFMFNQRIAAPVVAGASNRVVIYLADNGSSRYADTALIFAAKGINSGTDLAVAVAVTNTVTAGTTYDYQVTVTNLSAMTAAGVTVSNDIPTNVTYLANSAGLSWNAAASLLSGPLGTLAAGSSTHFTITVTAPASGTLDFTSRIDTVTADLNPANNSAANRMVIGAPTLCDVEVLTSVSPSGNVTNGSALRYFVVVTNRGPATATAVQVTNYWSDFVLFQGCTAAGAVTNAGSVSVALGDMPSGAWTNFAVDVKVSDPLAVVITNVVRAVTPSLESDAPVLANNTKTNLTYIGSPLSVSATWVFSRQRGWFLGTLTISNGTVATSYEKPFRYVVPVSPNCWLQYPDGKTVAGDPYVDITAGIIAALQNTGVYGGNGDDVLNPGEWAVVTGVELVQRIRTEPTAFIEANAVIENYEGIPVVIRPDGYAVYLEWVSVTNREYLIEQTLSLSSPFLPLTGYWIPATPPLNRELLPAGSSGFYRVMLRVKGSDIPGQ